MNKQAQLEQAIAALEDQRSILGDAVVDAALEPMRKQLSELEFTEQKQAHSFEGERKLVTVMFADISGFTTLLEKLDPEAVLDLVNACFDRLIPIIKKYEGTVEKFIGDEIMAIFGAPLAHENDPERAIHTALEMLDTLPSFCIEHDISVGMRVGISTGLVIAGGIGSEGQLQYGVTGDTVNFAKRLQGVAPIGGVLISHETYRQVRGVFRVAQQEPIQVKGKTKPVTTYLVQQVKPRAFRMELRGIEGIETRMVGREAELLTLKNIFRDVMEDSETRIVTVVGEAGVGKSRLLYEFEKWIELLPEEIWYFKGWASTGLRAAPFGAIRRIFTNRFEILESDSAQEVMRKFREGMAVALPPDQADLIGHLIGFDFPTSQALRVALDNESFRERALASLVEFLKVIAKEPTVLFVEDIHWADDSSLDLIDFLAMAMPESHLLIVCLARPALFERRPGWGEGRDAHLCLELKALSRRESRALVSEILQKVDEIPNELRDMVVEGAEGNPFYVEELIRMLIDDEVIQRGPGRWRIEMDQLAETRVPPTLAGVIQARLDSLPAEERALLQRASVVGRQFWDMAVAELGAENSEKINKEKLIPLLESVRGRELIFRREHSTFAETEEYIFKHALLRDVTYETVLLKFRRVYHEQVAAWLESASGERLGEYLELIANHYELAGDHSKAIEYLLRAGDRARLNYAHQEAIDAYYRALALLKSRGELRQAARTLMKLGLVYHTAFNYHDSRRAYEEGFALLQEAESNKSSVQPPSAPHSLRTLRGNPDSLDPTMTDHSDSSVPIIQLFSGLVEGSAAKEIMPDVAKSWEITDGGKRYIFHLRNDVRWSDGVPVTSKDFEFSWKRTLDPASGSPNAGLLYDIKGARAYNQGLVSDPDSVAILAPNDFTLEVELEGQTGYFLSLLAYTGMYPIPNHTVDVYGEAWTQSGHIVTNGAFKLDVWKKGELMVLKRNPFYHGQFRGNLDEVEIHFVVEMADRLELFESDQLDILGLADLQPAEWNRARRRHAGEYVSAPESATNYVGFNVRRPPFDDPRVRRAFALAIDKTTLSNVVLRGFLFPATGGFIPPGVPGHSAGIGLPYNPKQAQELLAEAGYPEGRGFPPVEAYSRKRIKPQTEFLKEQWQTNLGVEINWVILPWQDYLAKLEETPADIVQFGWMADYPDPDSFLRTANTQQRTGWMDEVYNELVEKARRVMDQEERLKLYAQADRILIEAAAIVPLTYSWSHTLVKTWVQEFPALALNEWLWKDIILKTHD